MNIEQALKDQFPEVITTLSVLGTTNKRPNSYTFRASTMQGEKVIKVVKPLRFSEQALYMEEEALELVGKRPELDVVQLESSGKLKFGSDELDYLVFPFMEGFDLSYGLANNKIGGEKDAKAVLDWLIELIHELALLGLIHQDIKPANIMQCGSSYLLLDLGIARYINNDKIYIKQQGPARYLSPEQVELGQERKSHRKRRITFMSDIYSAAVCALEIAVGQKEFNRIWLTDERYLASEKIRSGEIQINDPVLKEELAICLEYSPSTRLKMAINACLVDIEESDISIPPLWLLHYSTTGYKYIEEFASEYKTPGGVVFPSEYLTNSMRPTVEKLSSFGWQVIIDPSTYKKPPQSSGVEPTVPAVTAKIKKDDKEKEVDLRFKSRKYYVEDLTESNFSVSDFKLNYVNEVLEFQKTFVPTFYISPYFFISSPNDPKLDIIVSLYEETKKLVASLNDNTPVMLGLAVSEHLIKDRDRRQNLLDQIVLMPDLDGIFLRPELVKKDNSPCSDRDYLEGLLEISDALSLVKPLLVVQIDQSSLGLIAHTYCSAAICPDLGVRKNKIEEKLKGNTSGGFANPKDRRNKYYLPELLNDLDIDRELSEGAITKFAKSNGLVCNCPYCKKSDSLKSISRSDKNLHFVSRFSDQANELFSSPDGDISFTKMIDRASKLYSEMKDGGIIISAESGGDFLDNWKRVFSSK